MSRYISSDLGRQNAKRQRAVIEDFHVQSNAEEEVLREDDSEMKRKGVDDCMNPEARSDDCFYT
jgi:hypothetical protein